MAIDFTLPPEVLEARDRIRAFMQGEVAPSEARLREKNDLRAWRPALQELREKAKAEGLWAPHMPREWGGMGLRPLAMAFVSAECGRQQFGAYVLNCHAPDEGNMHTLLHWATPAQKEKFLHRANSELCTCGCKNDTLAKCYVNDETCTVVRDTLKNVLAEIRAGP